MKKETLLAIAAAITAIANNECGGSNETTAAETTGTGEDKPKRRGRPPGTSTPPATETTSESAAANMAEIVKQPEKPKLTEEQVEENYQKLRAIIHPFVTGTWTEPPQPKGKDVKKVLNKYKPEGWEGSGDYTTKELANFPEKFADFQRDIEALGY